MCVYVAHAWECGDMVKMGSKIKFHLENQRLGKDISNAPNNSSHGGKIWII